MAVATIVGHDAAANHAFPKKTLKFIRAHPGVRYLGRKLVPCQKNILPTFGV
jgi:hypothetical protein